MFYDELKETIVAYQAEIDENPEYEHIKALIEQNPSIWAKLNKSNNIIIFDVLKTYEDGPYRVDGDDLYVEILCICTMQIMYNYSESTASFSDIPYPEQLKEITMEYRDYGYTIPDLEKLSIPQVYSENERLNYAIVPVIVENYLGNREEYDYLEFEDEDEEEEDGDERKGNGEIRLPFNETNKEQQKMFVEKIINAARADGIDASFEECVSNYDHKRPEFILTFPNVTERQILKYDDMFCGVGIE